ncbi:necrosis inducing protein [Emericellopsis atlantica]|uniref:Necrosis inducing protein n=1 Tax=Emericellopsis atlantica TaxID=2614577 RepID=A0A9P8CLK8_9HYPO|nr:necrosis inducing protein [Emericellopsis atlantica]KAG9251503.1 necrosis inducing protein [Emericellopsis atlantica]
MVRAISLFSGLALAFAASADVIGHKDVQRFTESAPEIYLKFKPFLDVDTGCVPFPAVDKDGNISGGLKAAGDISGQCSESEGQLYARGRNHDGKFAIMYAWYFPKDQAVHGGGAGHRHDWEDVVVWLSSNSGDADFLGVATSGHGDYTKTKASDMKDSMDGSRPLIQYFSNGITNHELQITTAKGGEQALIEWGALGSKARAGLATSDAWGDAVMPMIDDNFKDKIAKAAL